MKKILLVSIIVLWASPSRADLFGKAARELAEAAIKKFGRGAAQEGAEKLAGRIASAAARHGDDALTAVGRIGPKALTLADEAGENAPRVLRLISRHGDEAAQALAHPKGLSLLAKYGDEAGEAMVKHAGVGPDLMTRFGDDAIKALGNVTPRNARRLAVMANQNADAASGLMGVVARHGDPAMDFIWRNKGALAVGTTLTAFLASPEPFINGTASLADTVGEHAVRPAVEGTAKAVSGLIWSVIVLAFGAVAGGVYLAVRHPRIAGGIVKAAVTGGRQRGRV